MRLLDKIIFARQTAAASFNRDEKHTRTHNVSLFSCSLSPAVEGGLNASKLLVAETAASFSECRCVTDGVSALCLLA
jgi:hypothetical protein